MDDPLEFLHGGGSIQMLSRCFPCLHGQRRKGDVERGERMERAKLL